MARHATLFKAFPGWLSTPEMRRLYHSFIVHFWPPKLHRHDTKAHMTKSTRRNAIGGFVSGVAILLLSASGSPLHAQDAPAQDVEGETIVVEGMMFSPEDIRNLSIVNPNVTRDMFGRAKMFVDCLDDLDLDLVARVVDGPPQDARTRFALDRLIRTRRGCYYGFPTYHPEQPEPFFGDCNPVFTGSADPRLSTTCRAVLDRGALFIGVLDRYAADQPLTRTQLFDRATQHRFLERETERNRQRFGQDKIFAFFAACFVQHAPELAARLLDSEPGSRMNYALQAAMIRRGAPCTGAAAGVRADPSVFRSYIAEAVYRWRVAVADSESLLPTARAR